MDIPTLKKVGKRYREAWKDGDQYLIDIADEALSDAITVYLERPEMVAITLRRIPDDWQYASELWNRRPTKQDLAYAYLWEQLSSTDKPNL